MSETFGCILYTRVYNSFSLMLLPEGFNGWSTLALWTPSALLLKGFGNCFGDTMLLGFPISFLSCYFQRAFRSPSGLLRGRLTSNIIFSRFSGGCGRGLLTQKSPPTNTFHFSCFSGRAREGSFWHKSFPLANDPPFLMKLCNTFVFCFSACPARSWPSCRCSAGAARSAEWRKKQSSRP